MCEELNTFVRGHDKATDAMVRAGADFKLERYVDTRFASRFKVAKRLLELEPQVRAVFADAQYVSYVSSAAYNWKEKHASARDIAMDNRLASGWRNQMVLRGYYGRVTNMSQSTDRTRN